MNFGRVGIQLYAGLVGGLLFGCAFTERVMPITMSNANVLAVLDTIDQLEVDAGELGKQQGASPQVKSFASRLTHEHTLSRQDRHYLADKLDVAPQKPQLALALEHLRGDATHSLRNKSGTEFDEAYIRDQITLHEQMIELIQNTEESMDQPDLRQHLRFIRPDLLSHLSAARAVARQFGTEQ